MVTVKRGRLGLLLRWLEVDTEKPSEEPLFGTSVEPEGNEQMIYFWEGPKYILDKKHKPYTDSFVDDVGLDRIPDATDNPVAELRYDFDQLSRIYLPEAVRNIDINGNVLNILNISYR